MKPDPLTITFPLDGRIERIANEISHYFTAKLLPTSAIWLDEGLSDVSHVHQFDNAHLEDLRLPERYAAAGPAYERLKNGENIIAENPERPDAHSTGDRLFVGLDDYGIHGTQLREFVQTLDRMAQGDKIIGVDEIKQAALEVSGKDITPLLDLLRPGNEVGLTRKGKGTKLMLVVDNQGTPIGAPVAVPSRRRSSWQNPLWPR